MLLAVCWRFPATNYALTASGSPRAVAQGLTDFGSALLEGER
jgi:hypothetical protein